MSNSIAGVKKKTKFPDWVLPYLSVIFPNYTVNELWDYYSDDGTNSNLFNNAPRALMCVEIKGKIQTLGALYNQGLLVELRINQGEKPERSVATKVKSRNRKLVHK